MKTEDKLENLRKSLINIIQNSGVMIEKIKICNERMEFTYYKDMKKHKHNINNY